MGGKKNAKVGRSVSCFTRVGNTYIFGKIYETNGWGIKIRDRTRLGRRAVRVTQEKDRS